jgi:hypothetical protein
MSRRPGNLARLRRVERAARRAAAENDRVAVVHEVPAALAGLDHIVLGGGASGDDWIACGEVRCGGRFSHGLVRTSDLLQQPGGRRPVPIESTLRRSNREADASRRRRICPGFEVGGAFGSGWPTGPGCHPEGGSLLYMWWRTWSGALTAARRHGARRHMIRNAPEPGVGRHLAGEDHPGGCSRLHGKHV